ncbi:MAG: hypothetical protein WAM14_09950, partial [Candidatus Nitrosopolaris sp.]
HDRKLLQGCKAARVWRVQVQKERSGAYTCAPSLSGLYSPANSQTQTAFVQDNKGMPSMEFVMSWVRKKTRQGFIHYIWNKLKQGISIRSLTKLIRLKQDASNEGGIPMRMSRFQAFRLLFHSKI